MVASNSFGIHSCVRSGERSSTVVFCGVVRLREGQGAGVAAHASHGRAPKGRRGVSAGQRQKAQSLPGCVTAHGGKQLGPWRSGPRCRRVEADKVDFREMYVRASIRTPKSLEQAHIMGFST